MRTGADHFRCRSDKQTNFVNPHQEDGTVLPWIEVRAVQASGAQKTAAMGKVGRNDECPCKSGKKFKKCCGSGSGPGAADGSGADAAES